MRNQVLELGSRVREQNPRLEHPQSGTAAILRRRSWPRPSKTARAGSLPRISKRSFKMFTLQGSQHASLIAWNSGTMYAPGPPCCTPGGPVVKGPSFAFKYASAARRDAGADSNRRHPLPDHPCRSLRPRPIDPHGVVALAVDLLAWVAARLGAGAERLGPDPYGPGPLNCRAPVVRWGVRGRVLACCVGSSGRSPGRRDWCRLPAARRHRPGWG